MSQPYTPSEFAIRDQWNGSAVGEEELAEANAEFARFIASIKADAWDVGYKAGLEDMSAVRDGGMTIHGLADNPYRTEDAA